MGTPKDGSPPLAPPLPKRAELPVLDPEPPAITRGGALGFDDDEATRRHDPFALDAPLEAPAPARPATPLEVRLPAAVLVVDEDRKRGARTAGRLMEHGYTCRVVTPPEVASVGRAQRYDAVVVEVGLELARSEFVSALGGLRAVAPAVVVSSPTPLELPRGVELLLLKPWLTEQAVRTVEEARRRAAAAVEDALHAPTLDAPAPPVVAAASEARTSRPPAIAPAAAASPGPGRSVSLDTKVVRARLMDGGDGQGITAGRVRRASVDGVLIIETKKVWPQASEVVAELALEDGRRADFAAHIAGASNGLLDVRLQIDEADGPFVRAWLDESQDPKRRGGEPLRLSPHPMKVAPVDDPGRGAGGQEELDRLWADASSDLDDDARQQRFIQACLRRGQLELAVRRYRGLKDASPADPRAQRYLQQVGTILGFYALKQNQVEVDEGGLSTRLKLTLGLFVLAAIALFVIGQIMN